MNRINKSPVVDEAYRAGFAVHDSVANHRKDNIQTEEALRLAGSLPNAEDRARAAALKSNDQMRQARKANQSMGRKIKAGIAGTALLLGVGMKQHLSSGDTNPVKSPGEVPAETAVYTVQPGDTAFEIGTKLEANHDGVKGNEDVRPFIDDVTKQAGPNGLHPGDKINVTESADLRSDIDGAQLDHK